MLVEVRAGNRHGTRLYSLLRTLIFLYIYLSLARIFHSENYLCIICVFSILKIQIKVEDMTRKSESHSVVSSSL